MPSLRLAALLPALPGAAAAHPGHLAAAAGHDHWIAGAAIAAGIGIAAWAILKGRRETEAAEAPEGETDEAAEEAEA